MRRIPPLRGERLPEQASEHQHEPEIVIRVERRGDDGMADYRLQNLPWHIAEADESGPIA